MSPISSQSAPTTSAQRSWQPAVGKPSPRHPATAMGLAAEILVEHDHLDLPSTLDWSAGLMVDRHLRPDLRLPRPTPVGYDTPGVDQDPERGCGVSIASGEPGLRRLLESLGYDCEGLSRHQLDWTFLAHHVELACRRYHAHDATTRSVQENMRLELSEFERAEALAIYANSFGIRGFQAASAHGVDVLRASSNCGGIATTLLMLAQVAGLEARVINTINHSTVELRVGGRWLWSDNIVGSRALILASYQEMLADPHDIVSLTPLELRYHADAVPHYRSPYNCSLSWWWKASGWQPEGVTGDTDNGSGYSLPYDPTTAEALYPGRRHRFHVPAGTRPMLCLSRIGGWIHAVLPVAGRSVRKVFHLDAGGDNPVVGGLARILISGDCDPAGLGVSLDGHALAASGPRSHLEHFTAVECELPRDLLTPGDHELRVTGDATCRGGLLLTPELLDGAPDAVLGGRVDLGPEDFHPTPISRTARF